MTGDERQHRIEALSAELRALTDDRTRAIAALTVADYRTAITSMRCPLDTRPLTTSKNTHSGSLEYDCSCGLHFSE